MNPAGNASAGPVVLVLSYFSVDPPMSGGKLRVRGLAESVKGIHLAVFPSTAKPKKALGGFNVRPLSLLNPLYVLRACVRAREIGPRLVCVQFEHSLGWPAAWLVGRLRRVPVVMDAMDVEAVYLRERSAKMSVRRVMAWFERRAARRASLILACSETDAETLSRHYRIGAQRVVVVPNGVFESPTVALNPGAKDLLFVGKLDYPPNREAVAFIDQELAPLLEKTLPGVRVRVVGAPRPALKSRNVVAAGYVNDLRTEFQTAAICVAPIFAGSGTRIKILEYLMAGRPVVCTQKAIEGLELADGVEVYVAEDAPGMVQVLGVLSENEALQRRLASAGRAKVLEKYVWPKIAETYAGAIQGLKLRP